MSLVCLTSQKGSPGATLTSLLLAAGWPHTEGRRRLLVEADPSGGSLALRYGLGLETSLITLAVAARAGLDSDVIAHHSQELPGGVPAVVAPDGPDQVRAALQAGGSTIGSWLAESEEIDAITDLGRLSDANIAVAHAASTVLMVARPEVEHLQPAARRMAELAERVPSVGWVLIGDRPHGRDEIEATYGHPVVAVLPDDARTAGALTAGSMSKRIMRSVLVRTASAVAEDIAAWLHPEPEPVTALVVNGPAVGDAESDLEPTVAAGEPLPLGVLSARGQR